MLRDEGTREMGQDGDAAGRRGEHNDFEGQMNDGVEVRESGE